MELTVSARALPFPAVSLLFISYTNRFLAYADLVRNLYRRWESDPSSVLTAQIGNLRLRIALIRNMQKAGALLGLSVSLVLLVWELTISVRALEIQMRDMEG